MANKVKLATLLAAATVAVPARVQLDVIAIVSVGSFEATVPAAFSMVTRKSAKFTPATVVAGGSVVKATLVAVVAYTIIALLLTVRELSVAVRVHDVPVAAVTVTAVKLSTPLVALCVKVPPPTVHPAEDVEIVIESVAPVPDAMTVLVLSSTETEKLGRTAPEVVPAGGCTVKTI
jgi:hypothetical protein